MAKSNEQKGKMREELKRLTDPEVDNVPSEEAPVVDTSEGAVAKTEAPEDSAFKTLEAVADKGDPVVLDSGKAASLVDVPRPDKRGGPTMISKPEAELLARAFNGKTKEAELPLEDTVQAVKDRNAELQKMKEGRTQQCSRMIRELRSLDPKGKKTCGRCGTRVPVEEMNSAKELCEVCAS